MTETTTTTARGKGRSERTTAGKADGFDAASFAGKGRETFESLLRTGAEAMSGNYDTLLAFNKERMEAAMKAFQDRDGMSAAGRKTMSAWLAGGRIAAEGWTGIAGKMVGCLASSVAGGVAASEKALECRDASELVDLHARETRRMMETWLAEGGAMSETAVRTAAAAMAPIADRVNAAVEEWATRPAAR